MSYTVVSLFAGGGGLDLGFQKAGFQILWANEFDKSIHQTYEKNHPNTILDKRDISKVKSEEIPESTGIIGGPSCQSWSCAGANRGASDKRGQVFFEYIRIIKDKRPQFFVIENVEGILRSTHKNTLDAIIKILSTDLDYQLNYQLLNAKDYEVPQDRKRVIFIGFRKDILPSNSKKLRYQFPTAITPSPTLRQAIKDLEKKAQPHNKTTNKTPLEHQYLDSDWSSQFMSRNRVRTWDQQAFTIPASGRHVPMHPQAPLMEKVHTDLFKFKEGKEHLYRRFTIREAARIQTFPDTYQFEVTNINHAYKIIGNAVPVNLAFHIAESVKEFLDELDLPQK